MTISVMIVDDEAIITDGLAQMIQSFGLPIASVKKFYASPTALDYLKVNAVDIVITDINMPVLNGIELIKAINQVAPTTQIIVLTGFGTLDYATEAMRYGVRYFLQKPTQPEQLKQAIQKSIQLLQESTENQQLQFKEKFELAANNQLTNVDDPTELPTFGMILFDEKLSERLKQPLLQVLKPLTAKVTTGNVRHAAYVLLQAPIDLTALVAKWQVLSGLSNSVLVWAADVHFAAVHHIITLAKGAFTDSFYYDHSILVNANDLKPHRQDTNQFISAYQAEMQRLMSKNDFIAAQAKTRLFFQAAKDERYDVEFLKVTCQQLVDQLIKTTKIKVNEELTLKIIYAANYLDLQATILNVIESIKRHTYIGHGSGNIVADLNLIIEKNFDNPNLSLRWIANNLLFLNSEYLGKVYAHQTNKRFTKALTDYRVNVAKAMLRQGDKVYEVANAVGYQNNTDYFSKQFKKRTGLTPKQYQLKKK